MGLRPEGMAERDFDHLIIGGGIMGSSIAMALAEGLGSGRGIAVLDADMEGEHSSTLKNAGGVRATWRNAANIELCQHSIGFYETVRDEVQFRQLGYYWMHDGRSWEEIRRNHAAYLERGLEVELHEVSHVSELLPVVDSLEGIAGLSISRRAGLLDHYSLRELYRGRARGMGVVFLDRHVVTAVRVEGGSAREVTARVMDSKGGSTEGDAVLGFLLHGGPLPGSDATYSCGTLINAAGAWAPRISRLYGFEDTQIRPRRRQMAVIRCPDVDLSSYGMIIDTSDVYFHKDADNVLAGYSNMDEPYGYELNFDFGGMDPESRFARYIWTPLFNRISGFERLKLMRGWAGLYAETPDRSGFLGGVPGFENVYECAGHTGRGLMISYGAGQALADLLTGGELRPELTRAADLHRTRPAGELYEQLHI